MMLHEDGTAQAGVPHDENSDCGNMFGTGHPGKHDGMHDGIGHAGKTSQHCLIGIGTGTGTWTGTGCGTGIGCGTGTGTCTGTGCGCGTGTGTGPLV